MTETELEMLAIFRDLFQSDAIELGSDFYALGGDSHMEVTLGLVLEDSFRLRIPVELLGQVTTVQGLAKWIDDARLGVRTA